MFFLVFPVILQGANRENANVKQLMLVIGDISESLLSPARGTRVHQGAHQGNDKVTDNSAPNQGAQESCMIRCATQCCQHGSQGYIGATGRCMRHG